MAGAAAKTTVGEESLFLSGKALPADIAAFVVRCDESVVMVHLTIAFFAANKRFIGRFRVDGFCHNRLAPESDRFTCRV